MPQKPILSAIKLPDGTAYDLHVAGGLRDIGVTSTSLSNNATTNPISIDSADFTAKQGDIVRTEVKEGSTVVSYNYFLAVSETTAATNNLVWKSANKTAVEDGIELSLVSTGEKYVWNAKAPIDSPAFTGVPTAPTAAAGTDTTQIATTAFVQAAIVGITEPMVFIGGITATADSTDTTKCSFTDSSGSALGTIKKGYTYKITSIAATPAYTGTLKVGDTLIAAKNNPKVDATWVADTDWVIVPSGDEPSGTVTSIGVSGSGLHTSETGDAAITTSGTISLALKGDQTTSTNSAAAKGNTASREYALGTDQNGNLSVNVPWTDTTYTGSAPISVDPGTHVVSHNTSGVTAVTTAALKKMTVNDTGHVTGAADVDTTTVAKTIAAAAPGQTAPDNSVVYYSVSGEELSLYQLGYTTRSNIATTVADS